MDTGLCAYLCKWPTAEMLERGIMSGAFYETYVVSEIIKSYYNNGLNPKDICTIIEINIKKRWI